MASVALPIVSNGITTSYSHAVSRSSELLSCAKTALKIAKAQHAQEDDHGGTMWWACQDIQDLQLCVWKDVVGESPTGRHLEGLCEDGLSLLRGMEVELTQLEQLVRRRGHTNDPTEEIAASVRRLETDAKELSMLVKTGFSFPKASAHYQRHTQLIATWLQTVATQQTSKLKEILKVRGNVLADQAQRRKLLSPDAATTTNTENMSGAPSLVVEAPPATKPMIPPTMDTPLFSLPPIQKPPTNTFHHVPNGTRNGGTTNGTASGGYGGGGGSGGASGAGYGGASSYYGSGGGYGGTSATTGMRQRRQPKATMQQQQPQQAQDESDYIQMQIQQRQQQRQTETRLQEAQQAERTLAELGTMFSKMTSLISQQGEVLEKIEDDVESGLDYVTAGQQEITTLYSIKKGNRGLIIKVFGLLIFLIIFMRFYKSK